VITEDDEWSRIEREIKRRSAQEPSRTTLRQAAQMALEALDKLSKLGNGNQDGNSIGNTIAQEAREHLFTALAQPEQEPVAWFSPSGALYRTRFHAVANGEQLLTPLYATPPAAQPEPPPEWEAINNIIAEYGLDAIAFVAEWKAAQRPWQGLTDEDWEEIDSRKETVLDTFAQGAVWAQQRLRERNT